MSSGNAGLWTAARLGELLMFAGTAVAYLATMSKQRSSSTELTQALRDGTTLNAKERVCTVDENNNVIQGGHFRNEMRLQKLWHRATYVLVIHQPPKGQREEQDTPHQWVLVQKRSRHKDYCPGKLDPTPGGVVGYGESYRHNVTRELQEEMGIDVEDEHSPHTLTRLFTFPYQDDRVKVWGDFYEVVYCGTLEDLVLQESEVESIERMTLENLQRRIQQTPDEFMPDAVHAVNLYFQRKQDEQIQRKLLTGYSSGNLEHYRLRPKPEVVFFDCDDCLYFDGWKVANMLTHKIEDWCTNHGLKQGQAYELYKQYGTALKGLLAEGYLEHTESAIDGYLRDVHDIPIADHLKPDPQLRSLLERIDPSIKMYIFTASVRHHAERCLQALGIADLFDGRIIDVKECALETKHARSSFETAMRIAGVTHPERCVFLDDSLKNLETARLVGWRAILVGRVGRDCGSQVSSDHAEHEIDRIHDFPTILPELFPTEASASSR